MTEPLYDLPTVWELVRQRAAATPDAPLLIDATGRTVTCAQLAEQAERVAAGLHGIGVKAGTPVVWQLPTRIESVVLSMALARLGAVQTPVIAFYREKEVGFVLRETGAEVVFVPGEWKGFDFAAMARGLAAEVTLAPQVVVLDEGLPEGDPALLPAPPSAGDEVRWIYYTSGTTSDPKGVRHTDQTLMNGGKGLAVALDMSPSDIGSVVFPYAHIAGPDYVFMLLQVGFPAILLESFVPADAVEVFTRLGATMAGGSTAFYTAYLAEQRKNPGQKLIPSLRLLSGGGAPKPPEVYFEVKAEMGVPVVHGYGMTECPMIAMGSPHDTEEQLANTDGKPVVGADVRIVKQDGSVAAAGEEGEVRLRGPIVFAGYTDDALTKEAFDDDGFFRTGDVGILRADGHLTLTGRLKDIIIRKGENISAKEIEDLLYEHPKVGQVAVIGVPDRERGEMVVAVVQPPEGGAALGFDEMVEYLRGKSLMTQKIPERLEVVDGLPRNETLNKVLKYKLREQFGGK